MRDMAKMAMCARILMLLALVMVAQPLTMDEDATNTVRKTAEDSLNGGEMAIIFRGPRGRSSRREELLHAKGADDISISVFYNRKDDQVSLESLHGDHLKSVSWTLGDHSRTALVLVMTSSRVRVVAGCKQLRWHSMSGKHNLLATLASHKIKLYHDENMPIEVYTSERSALNSINCDHHEDTIRPPALTTVGETDYEEVKDFIAKEARRKREEVMLGDDYRTNYVDPNALPQPPEHRGDIPTNAIETCDDEVVRQLSYLRRTIEQLHREIVGQKGTIDGLRNQLRQCCNRLTTPPPVDRCTGSSCYPGY